MVIAAPPSVLGLAAAAVLAVAIASLAAWALARRRDVDGSPASILAFLAVLAIVIFGLLLVGLSWAQAFSSPSNPTG